MLLIAMTSERNFREYSHFASAASTSGLCPLDSRAFAAGTSGLCPLDSRRGITPDPEMLTHLCFACGRDEGFWCIVFPYTVLACPP